MIFFNFIYADFSNHYQKLRNKTTHGFDNNAKIGK